MSKLTIDEYFSETYYGRKLTIGDVIEINDIGNHQFTLMTGADDESFVLVNTRCNTYHHKGEVTYDCTDGVPISKLMETCETGYIRVVGSGEVYTKGEPRKLKIGTRVFIGEREYVLAETNERLVTLIDISSGKRWDVPEYVSDTHGITKVEFNNIIGNASGYSVKIEVSKC